MNNLYHKVAVTSICTVLGFALGANKETKAGTLILSPSAEFTIAANGYYPPNLLGLTSEGYSYYEFDIGSLPPTYLLSNNMSRFTLSIQADYSNNLNPNYLYIFGYVAKGLPDNISVFEKAVFINDVFIGVKGTPYVFPGDPIKVDVTSFVRDLLDQGNTLAGFNFRSESNGLFSLTKPQGSYLVIENNVPDPQHVPEPTTIFGSALALSLGRWLKRKSLNQNNKTTPHS
jgi:hypothetical protein